MQATRQRMTTVDAEEFFDFQRCSSAQLPDPTPLIENLATGVIEVLLGVRGVQQLARFVTEGLFQQLMERALMARQQRAVRRERSIPGFAVGTVHVCHPADGIVEAAVVVRSAVRTRAVAMRLEGLDGRWRATAIRVL